MRVEGEKGVSPKGKYEFYCWKKKEAWTDRNNVSSLCGFIL